MIKLVPFREMELLKTKLKKIKKIYPKKVLYFRK